MKPLVGKAVEMEYDRSGPNCEMTVPETYVYLDHTIPDIFAPLDVSMYPSQIDPFLLRDRVSILVLAGLKLYRPDCLLTHTDVPAYLPRAGISGMHHHISPYHTPSPKNNLAWSSKHQVIRLYTLNSFTFLYA